MDKLIKGISVNSVINHPTGDLDKNITGQDLLNDFDKYHILFRSHYQPEFWKAEKMRRSKNVTATKQGSKVRLQQKNILLQRDGRKMKTSQTINIVTAKKRRKTPLTIGGQTYAQLR